MTNYQAPNVEEIRHQLSEVSSEIEKKESEIARHERAQDEIKRDGERLNRSINEANGRLRQIEDMKNQRLNLLKLKNRHTYEAVLWLRENQHLFKMKIFEPPFLEVQVKDQRFANEIECFFNRNTMFLFVSQCREDTELFLSELSDKKNLRLNIQECDSDLNAYSPRVSLENVNNFINYRSEDLDFKIILSILLMLLVQYFQFSVKQAACI